VVEEEDTTYARGGSTCHGAERTLDTTGLVVEDAPSGLLAGRAAGARTLAVCTSHTRDEIVASGASPDFFRG